MKTLYTIIFILIASVQLGAKDNNVKNEFEAKVNQLYTKYREDGFATYRKATLDMETRTETPVFMQLKEGHWYQFVVVGDPEATKFEFKLGLEGVGEIITDKFKPETTGEYWTTFSFICPRNGNYLMTFFQRAPGKTCHGHIGVMEKSHVGVSNGMFTIK
jgi:hypothetical protein